MATTSVKTDSVLPERPRDHAVVAGTCAFEGAAPGRWSPETTSPAGWRRQLLETVTFLGVIAFAQHRLGGGAEIPGLPHPYWLPVLLASCQYGVAGGMIATVGASVVYFLGLSPQSGAQDFYAYARMVVTQPSAWLATALIVGGLRSLHIHQYADLADELAVSRRRATELGAGLERAAAEINALERRIAVDASSVAALSRSLSGIDMTSRRAAAMSLGGLFRVAAGARTFTLYLKGDGEYAPVWAIEEDSPRSTNVMKRLPATAVEAMIIESAVSAIVDDAERGESRAGRHFIGVPPIDAGAEPLAAIVCELEESQDRRQFRRRAEDLARMFAAILSACPVSPSGAQS